MKYAKYKFLQSLFSLGKLLKLAASNYYKVSKLIYNLLCLYVCHGVVLPFSAVNRDRRLTLMLKLTKQQYLIITYFSKLPLK